MLKSKNAVVTGSTSGIGHAMALALAGAGANVMLNGLGTAAEIEAARAAVVAAGTDVGGVRVLYHPADMTKPAEIADLIARAESDLGSVDILCCNAGIQHVAAIEEFPLDKWDLIIAINLSSAFHAIRAAVPGMKKRGWGRIITTASVHSLVASPHKAAYNASKHGIAGLTKSVALELAEHGVTCNAISPGAVMTPLVLRQLPDLARTRGISEDEVLKKVLLASQPNKRAVEASEIGALVVFLASDAAASITGANLPVDGGWTAQ